MRGSGEIADLRCELVECVGNVEGMPGAAEAGRGRPWPYVLGRGWPWPARFLPCAPWPAMAACGRPAFGGLLLVPDKISVSPGLAVE